MIADIHYPYTKFLSKTRNYNSNIVFFALLKQNEKKSDSLLIVKHTFEKAVHCKKSSFTTNLRYFTLKKLVKKWLTRIF